jgi:hypothetical protein
MELRRLLDALHPSDFGKHFSEEAGFIQKFKGSARMAFNEHFGQLVAHSLAADGSGFGSQAAHGGSRCGVQLEAEAGSEAHGAQHAQMVFFKAQFGLADGANDAGFEVGQSAHVVDDRRAKIFMKLFWKIFMKLFWKIALKLFCVRARLQSCRKCRYKTGL